MRRSSLTTVRQYSATCCDAWRDAIGTRSLNSSSSCGLCNQKFLCMNRDGKDYRVPGGNPAVKDYAKETTALSHSVLRISDQQLVQTECRERPGRSAQMGPRRCRTRSPQHA